MLSAAAASELRHATSNPATSNRHDPRIGRDRTRRRGFRAPDLVGRFAVLARGYGGGMEHDEQAERLEREAEHMEHEGERLERHIEDTRRDWEGKESDASVPGAQPDPGDEEEGSMETPREESDQLPEEGPPEQVPDDESGGGSRDDAEETPGVPGEEETATGNPAAAGAEDPDEGSEGD
jgi:hypothetical protein